MNINRGGQIEKEKIFTRDFALIWFANFFIFLGFQMTLPTVPIFVNELGGSDQLIGVIVGVFTFSALVIRPYAGHARSEEHTSELQSRGHLVCRLLLEKKKKQ